MADSLDPSERTIEYVDRAIVNLDRQLTSRLDAKDAADLLLSDNLTRVPTLLDRAVSSVRELFTADISKLDAVTAERFARIDMLFTEGDKRTQQLSTANALALAAALQAAKEAVGEQNRSNGLAISKSEASFIEALKQQQTLFQTEIKAANEKIGQLTSRLDKGEGSDHGVTTNRTERRLDAGVWISIAAAFFAAMAALELFLRH